MTPHTDTTDRRLDTLTRRVDGLHQRLDAITARLDAITARLATPTTTPTGPVARNGHHFYPGTGWIEDPPPHQEHTHG
jgi:hypothetical protein